MESKRKKRIDELTSNFNIFSCLTCMHDYFQKCPGKKFVWIRPRKIPGGAKILATGGEDFVNIYLALPPQKNMRYPSNAPQIPRPGAATGFKSWSNFLLTKFCSLGHDCQNPVTFCHFHARNFTGKQLLCSCRYSLMNFAV